MDLKQPFRWVELRDRLKPIAADFIGTAKLFGVFFQDLMTQQNWLSLLVREMSANELKFGFHLASLMVAWQDMDHFGKEHQDLEFRVAMNSLIAACRKLREVIGALAEQEVHAG